MGRRVIARIRTDKDVHFTGALATGAYEEENIETALSCKKMAVLQAEMLSDQNLDYELWFFSKDTYDDVNLDDDAFLGKLDFDLATDGYQYGGSGKYYLSHEYAQPLILIDDDVGSGQGAEIHVALMNRDAVSKAAGGTGEVVVILTVEPVG
jgi:hypothetical protein